MPKRDVDEAGTVSSRCLGGGALQAIPHGVAAQRLAYELHSSKRIESGSGI